MSENNEKTEEVEVVNYIVFPEYRSLEVMSPKELMEVKTRIGLYEDRIIRELRKHQQR